MKAVTGAVPSQKVIFLYFVGIIMYTLGTDVYLLRYQYGPFRYKDVPFEYHPSDRFCTFFFYTYVC